MDRFESFGSIEFLGKEVGSLSIPFTAKSSDVGIFWNINFDNRDQDCARNAIVHALETCENFNQLCNSILNHIDECHDKYWACYAYPADNRGASHRSFDTDASYRMLLRVASYEFYIARY